MKKFLVTLLSVLILVTGVAFIAACDSCDSDEDVLATYVLPESGSLVESDFTLPKKIGDKSVKWTSDNNAITIEDGTDYYTAKVTLGDEVEAVTLTVTCGNEVKSFEVNVVALDVNYIAEKYEFKNNFAIVFADFDLDTSFVYAGKTATISWSVDEKYNEYINLNEAGTKCLVTESSIDTEVQITATFSYNDKTRNISYKMTVSYERDHLEEVDYWYNNTGVSITMKGYVVEIATAYDSGYKNVSLYMVDEDFCAGYYLYRVVTDDENGDLLEAGTYVTVTGTINTNYNGLIETSAGGKLVVDKSKSMSADELYTHVYALDNDLLAGAPAAIYKESTLVSLDKWEVVEMYKDAPKAGSTSTLFTLQKGNVKVSVAISKYLEGAYLTKEGDVTWDALVELYSNIKKGDVVSVKGVLGYYNAYQILPLSAEDVKVEESAATAAPDYVASVTKAIKDVAAAIPTYIVPGNSEFTLPASNDVVEISYEDLHDSAAVEIAEGKIIVTAGKEDMATILVTYTVKDSEDNVLYTTSTFHYLHSMFMEDEDIADSVWVFMDLETTSTAADNIDFNKDNGIAPILAQYPSAKITWTIAEDSKDVTGVEIVNNVLVVTPDFDKDRTVDVVASVTCGETEARERTYTITISKVTPFEVGNYNLVLDLTNATDVAKKLYFAGTISSANFGETTEDATKAAVVAIAEVDGGYTMTVNGKYLELNSSNRMVLVDTKTDVWKYDYSLKLFTWTVNSNIYYLGTYTSNGSTFTTISASKTSFISGSSAANVGKTQFPVNYIKTTATPSTPSTPETPSTPSTPSTPTVVVPSDGSKLDFVGNFETYASDWSESYSAHDVTFALSNNSNITVSLSNADKQRAGNSIDNMPVIAVKNGTQYVTLNVTDISVSAIEFTLTQWTTKTFNDIHIEYTTDGTTWTTCSEIITTPGVLASNAAIPAGATQIRLSLSTTNTSNVQVGLSSIALTIA